jgi:hypothetical protein
MVHISDIPATLRRLHQSLKPNGYLVFNVDSRKPTATSQWHLYDAHYPIIRYVRATGFRKLPKIPPYPLYCYQKVERSPLNAIAVGFFDHMRHNRFETKISEYTQSILSQVRILARPYKETIKKVRARLSR